MGDEMPRGQLLAERLHLHGVIAKDWRAMSATEQAAIASAVEDYDDMSGNDPRARDEQEAMREELDELKRERDGLSEDLEFEKNATEELQRERDNLSNERDELREKLAAIEKILASVSSAVSP